MQKRLFILSMLLVFASLLSVSAQDDATTFRVWSPIESITTNSLVSDDAGLVIWDITIAGTHSDGCDLDLFTDWIHYDNNFDIQIYREIPIAMTCLQVETPFEISLTLSIPMTDLPPYVIVNDQVWSIDWFTGDDQNEATLEELVLVGVVIDDVTTTYVAPETEDDIDKYQLALSGSHGVGCKTPLVYSVRQLAESTLIGVFDPVPELAICPAMLIILDETIEIPATLIRNDTLVTVNEYVINELEAQAMSNTNKVMTNINSVSVNVMESFPMQISLDVSGEHPDGCDYPVKVDQSRSGNTVTISVYREVPNDVMCPMMLNPYDATIKLDGTFESGSYTIKVNGDTQKIDI